MKIIVKYLILYMPCILWLSFSVAQTNKEDSYAVNGRLVDSTAASSAVQGATVTIISKKTDKILKYGISNARGQFALSGIPKIDSAILIRVAHLSFMPYSVEKIIAGGAAAVDLGTVLLEPRRHQLDEVPVGPPPILMNKDTLEIYPDAFSLQPNSVVEDLLKKVPGVVVWGDGQITVNGKKVTTVLVEGKPFFGGDPVTATRNLPKDAISKIKVYEDQTRHDDEQQNLNMDILLKNDKKEALFGKINAGVGNEKRKEGMGLLNYFNRRNQVSLYGGANNTNKEAYTARDFLKANTYKAGGEDLSAYASSFSLAGLNTFRTVGSRIEHSWNDSSNAELDLLYYSKDVDVIQSTQEIIDLMDRKQNISTDRTQNTQNDVLRTNTASRFTNGKSEVNLSASIDQTSSRSSSRSSRQVDEGGQLLSAFDNFTDYDGRKGMKNLYVEYTSTDEVLTIERWKLSYRFKMEDHQFEETQTVFYRDGATSPQLIDRMKANDRSGTQHEVYAMGDIFALLQKYRNWRLQASSFMAFGKQTESQEDHLFNPVSNGYSILNRSLTFDDNFKETTWRPGLRLSRTYYKMLGRGSNRWGFFSEGKYEQIDRTNASDHAGRRVENRFRSFLPSTGIHYTLNRGGGSKTFRVTYNTIVLRPQLHQQVSLMDTIMKDFNYVGNPLLRSETQRQFEFKYSSNSPKNSVGQSLTIKYALRDDMFGDSSIIDDNGRHTLYTTNVKGKPFFSADYQYMTAMKIFNRPANIFLLTGLDGGRNGYFMNEIEHETRNFSIHLVSKLTYLPVEALTVKVGANAGKSYVDYASFQSNALSTLVEGDIILNWPKRTTLINSLNVRTYKLTGIPTDKQYLWNMQLYHRFAPKEQFEVKLSFYDILKQRRNLVNVINNNRIRQQTTNNLQQYFMISFSYFPRMF